MKLYRQQHRADRAPEDYGGMVRIAEETTWVLLREQIRQRYRTFRRQVPPVAVKWMEHVEHRVELAAYGTPAVNVALQCIDCGCVIDDYDLAGADPALARQLLFGELVTDGWLA